MQRLTLNKFVRFAIVVSMSIFLIFLGWLISPGLSDTNSSKNSTSYAEVFDQVWQTINDNFYDPNFNGVDWAAMRKKYKPQINQVQSNQAAADVINQMLSELHVSHTHYYIKDEPAYYQVLAIFKDNSNLQDEIKKNFPNGKIEYTGIGLFTQTSNGKTFISAVLDGSPAAEAKLQTGDQILSVEGQPFQPIESFAGKAGRPVKLLIQRSPDPDSHKEIPVTPKLLNASTMFLDAQKASTQVLEREGKKIAYTHIWSYAGEQYQHQLETDLIYDRLKDADALVLDLREGWGGAPITALNIYSKQRDLSITSILRSGERYTNHAQWTKPVVMLVNQGSRSAKEILAFGFQEFGLGPVVGTQTAGAVVAARPFMMKDGSLLYVAVANVYINQNQRLEGKGVTPDIVVPFTLEYAQGADPQKERAIAAALEAIKQRG